MAQSDGADGKKVSRRGFIAGAAVGATGAIIGREVAAQTIDLGNIDDLPDEWWNLPDGWWDNPPTDDGPDTPPETDPPVDDGPVVDNPPPPQPETNVRVRRNVFTLDPAGPEIASIRRGIQVMQGRSDNDPTSWTFQAAVHGFFGQRLSPIWGTCEHSQHPHFLSWHRMYLYFFERILREASGDPNLTLPYWDYGSPGRSALPDVFRFPQDSSNPLFVSQRRAAINNGLGVADQFQPGDHRFGFIVDSEGALNRGFFSGPSGFNGSVETTPHNGVHGQIGGWMNGVQTAALDPIFWFHHCNVDRLWNRWAARWNRQPTDNFFLGRQYQFADENRQIVTIRAGDVLDTAGQLGYRYDDDPTPPVGFVVAGLEPAQPTRAFSRNADPGVAAAMAAPEPQAMVVAAPERLAETLATSGGAVTLGGSTGRGIGVRLNVVPPLMPVLDVETTGRLSTDPNAPQAMVAAPEPPSPRETFRTAVEEPDASPVLLQLEGIDFDQPEGIYTIYVNLPQGTRPDPRGPYYAGYFAPFAQTQTDNPESIDITGLLNRQIEAGLFDGGEPTVQFFPLQREAGEEYAPVRIGSVRIVRQ